MRTTSPLMFGAPLKIDNQRVYFSFWPACIRSGKFLVDDTLWTNDPWSLVEASFQFGARSDPETVSLQKTFLLQAKEFYNAGSLATPRGARATLHYYAFLNLAKCLVLQRGSKAPRGKILHGLHATVPDSSKHALLEGTLKADPHGKATAYAFAEFCNVVGDGISVEAETELCVGTVSCQSLVAHRLWCRAGSRAERFVKARYIDLWDTSSGTFSLTVGVLKEHADRHFTSSEGFLEAIGLDTRWKPHVELDRNYEHLLIFECPLEPKADSKSPLEAIPAVSDLVACLRPALSRYVTTAAPAYRDYFFYVLDPLEDRLGQLPAMYALMFYLGSMARYQPARLTELLDSPFGPFVAEFLAVAPTQFLYLVASEFQQQEVARAAVLSE